MSKTRILIVENNPMDVELLRIAFHYAPDWKIELTVANDGDEAIHQLASASAKPDLVILDLSLPKRSGIDVLRVIRTSPEYQQLPVIVFSSSPTDALRVKVRESNIYADAYVSKPAELETYYSLAERFRGYLQAGAPA